MPVMDRWLLHAPLVEAEALVNGRVLELVRQGDQGILEELGLTQMNQAQALEPVLPEGPPQPGFLGLIPTRGCNMACSYCAFGAAGHQGRDMPLELAANAVEAYCRSFCRNQGDTLEVHFFGGEPMHAPRVVETAVHKARYLAAQEGLKPRFEMATNGIYGPAEARFLGDHLETVVLSFDGPGPIQNLHRPLPGGRPSFEAVARSASIFSESPATLCLRVCVSAASAGLLLDTTEFLCSQFQPGMMVFEALQATPESAAAGLEPPDPFVFAKACWRAMALARSFGVEPVYAAARVDQVQAAFCPVGRDCLIVSPSGRVSGCYLLARDWQQRGLDLDLGQVDENGFQLSREALERVRGLCGLPARCRGCLARWHCTGGCKVNQTYPGCPDEYNDFCRQTRLLTTLGLLETLECHGEIEKLLESDSAQERLAGHYGDELRPGWMDMEAYA